MDENTQLPHCGCKLRLWLILELFPIYVHCANLWMIFHALHKSKRQQIHNNSVTRSQVTTECDMNVFDNIISKIHMYRIGGSRNRDWHYNNHTTHKFHIPTHLYIDRYNAYLLNNMMYRRSPQNNINPVPSVYHASKRLVDIWSDR